MAIKPTLVAPWATSDVNNGPSGEPNKAIPDSSKWSDGWNYNEIVPRDWWNYQLNNTYQWLTYIKELNETTLVASQNFGQDPNNTTGLTFSVFTSPYKLGTVVYTPAGVNDTVTLVDDSTNYVYFDAVASNLIVTSSLANIQPGTDFLLYKVVTVAGAITATTDYRDMVGTGSAIWDGGARHIVEEPSASEALSYLERSNDVAKSVGFQLVDIAGTEYASLLTKVNGSTNTVFTLNLDDDSISFGDDVIFQGGHTVTFNQTPVFPASMTLPTNLTLSGINTISGATTTTNTLDVNGGLTVSTGLFEFNSDGQFDGSVDFNGSVTFNSTVDLNQSVDPSDIVPYVVGNYVEAEGSKSFSATQSYTEALSFITPRSGTVRFRVAVTAFLNSSFGGDFTINVQRNVNGSPVGPVVTVTGNTFAVTVSDAANLDVVVVAGDILSIDVETTGGNIDPNASATVTLASGNPITMARDFTV